MGEALGPVPRLLWAWRGKGRKGRGHSRCQVRASYVLLSAASSLAERGRPAALCLSFLICHTAMSLSHVKPSRAYLCGCPRCAPAEGPSVPAPAPTWWWLAGHCLGSWASCPVHSRQQLLIAPARAWGRPTDCEPASPHELQMDPAPQGWPPDRCPAARGRGEHGGGRGHTPWPHSGENND